MELKDIVKGYNGRTVINGFSMKADKDRAVCLFGPSGCGKTTILNIIAGLTRADSGMIMGNNLKISYLFQENRLLENLSAEKNIMLTASNPRAALELVELIGFKGALKLYTDDMSGGMKRITAILRAIAYDGDIFLLDEPFNGIDEKTAERIAGYIRELNKICIIVTHSSKEAEWLDAEIIKIC